MVRVISSDRFLKRQELGNDVPFFICAFEPKEADAMEKIRQSLARRLEKNSVTILEVNLYDLCVEILKQEGDWGEIIEKEPRWSKSELKELLQNVLAPETYLAPKIAEMTARNEYDVLFLCGIGEVYPYVRSHNVLHHLQSRIPKKPVVIFFPGRYEHTQERGMSLDLFGRLHDRYYRAFNIFDIEPYT